MSVDNPGVQSCPLARGEVCLEHPPAALAPIQLEDARNRFNREAVRATCDTGRYRLPYFTWGVGPPLLFVHGVTDSSHSFLLPISRLAAHFRCIAYDLPTGRGDGARLRRYTHADLVTDLLALLDHLGVRRSYVYGSSFGSTIVLAALRARPERLPRAILQGGLAWRPLARRERLLAWLARYLPGSMRHVPLRNLVLRAIMSGPFAGRPPAVWDYFLECSGRGPVAQLAHQVRMLAGLDLRPLLPEVRQPVLLICGDRDPIVGPAYADVLMQGLPNAGRVVIEGCGHCPSYSHPEVLAEVVRQFLTPSLENQ
jgi:pimeloyl-ACP methyl ester carboxylesterase